MNKFIEMFEQNVNVGDLKNALNVTWQGLATIFIVMAVIAIIVFISTKFPIKKK